MTNLRRALCVTVSALALASTATGCGDEGGSESPLVATYAAAGEGGDGAVLEGTLVLENGCTYVDGAGGNRWLPIFVDVVTGDGEALTYGTETLEYGDEVSLTGGESSITDGVEIPEACSLDVPVWRVVAPVTG